MLSLFTLPPNSTQEALVPLAFCASTRTLANIVWSCLAPIIACAWVAIHPNVPSYPEVWWKSFRRRALIFFCALIAPEFTLWWALRQWKGAKSIQRQFEPFADKKTWSLTHAQFLQMGGFLLCDHDKNPLETLSQPTLAHLLDSNQISFPNITKQEILDKSKSDAFAATVASFQTFWFILQIIARAEQRLPVSELEIVTLGYAVLNGAIYFLWWSKPLNVAYPIPLYLNPGASYHQTLKDREKKPHATKDLPEVPSEPKNNESAHTQEELLLEAQSTPPPNPFSNIFNRVPFPLQIILGLILIVLVPALALAVLGICLAIGVAAVALALAVAIAFFIFALIILALGHAARVPFIFTVYNFGQTLFSNVVEPSSASHVPMYSAYDPTKPNQPATTSFATTTTTTANPGREPSADHHHQASNDDEDTQLLISGGAFSIIFGAIHCIAWSFHFPTEGERITWRVCALLVTCIPLVYITTAAALTRRRRSTVVEVVVSKTNDVRGGAGLVVLVFCLNVYAVARLVLLILAVIGLRSMPLEMFLAVRWVDFLPHY